MLTKQLYLAENQLKRMQSVLLKAEDRLKLKDKEVSRLKRKVEKTRWISLITERDVVTTDLQYSSTDICRSRNGRSSATIKSRAVKRSLRSARVKQKIPSTCTNAACFSSTESLRWRSFALEKNNQFILKSRNYRYFSHLEISQGLRPHLGWGW